MFHAGKKNWSWRAFFSFLLIFRKENVAQKTLEHFFHVSLARKQSYSSHKPLTSKWRCWDGLFRQSMSLNLDITIWPTTTTTTTNGSSTRVKERDIGYLISKQQYLPQLNIFWYRRVEELVTILDIQNKI